MFTRTIQHDHADVMTSSDASARHDAGAVVALLWGSNKLFRPETQYHSVKPYCSDLLAR